MIPPELLSFKFRHFLRMKISMCFKHMLTNVAIGCKLLECGLNIYFLYLKLLLLHTNAHNFTPTKNE